MAEEEKEDVSKAVRELVELGRLHLAMEKYRSAGASLEKAARILPGTKMPIKPTI